MYQILTLNAISGKLNEVLDPSEYQVGRKVKKPSAIIVRNSRLMETELDKELLAIGRIGLDCDNLPLKECSDKGIVVFNSPSTNVNAVKELAIGSIIMATRNMLDAIDWCKSQENDITSETKNNRKAQFVGYELKNKVLGLVGLDEIAISIAQAASQLGLKVIATDQNLRKLSKLSNNIELTDEKYLAMNADIISIHNSHFDNIRYRYTNDFINGMKKGAILLNFTDEHAADIAAIKEALSSGHIAKYIVDFPTKELLNVAGVITFPNLGSSTFETEDNSTVLIAEQIRNYIESGEISNSVNFPTCIIDRCEKEKRIAICHKNMPNLINKFTGIISMSGANIEKLVNKANGENAYTVIDLNKKVTKKEVIEIERLEEVMKARII